MSVGVCISNYNSGDSIRDAIESVMEQNYTDIHFFIVDNASNDESIDYLEQLVEDRPDIITLVKLDVPDPNAIKTINMALRLCPYEYTLVMDDDAYLIGEDVLSKLVETLKFNPKAAVVGANPTPYQFYIHDIFGNRLTPEETDNLGVVCNIEFHGSCALFRTESLKWAGCYNETFIHYMNELELSLIIQASGDQVLFRSDAFVSHPSRKGIKPDLAIQYIKNYNAILKIACLKPIRAVILSTVINGYSNWQWNPKYISFIIKELVTSFKRCEQIEYADQNLQYINSEILYNNLKRAIFR